jgi:hypothetical protein
MNDVDEEKFINIVVAKVEKRIEAKFNELQDRLVESIGDMFKEIQKETPEGKDKVLEEVKKDVKNINTEEVKKSETREEEEVSDEELWTEVAKPKSNLQRLSESFKSNSKLHRRESDNFESDLKVPENRLLFGSTEITRVTVSEPEVLAVVDTNVHLLSHRMKQIVLRCMLPTACQTQYRHRVRMQLEIYSGLMQSALCGNNNKSNYYSLINPALVVNNVIINALSYGQRSVRTASTDEMSSSNDGRLSNERYIQ